MILIDEEQEAATHGRTLALAVRCEWLQIVLAHQDRVLASATALAASCGAGAWARQALELRDAVEHHFELEECVVMAALEATGLRAHAVLGDASRSRIRRCLEELAAASWRQGEALAERLRSTLDGHFLGEESRTYRPLARQQSDDANAALARRCRAVVEGERR